MNFSPAPRYGKIAWGLLGVLIAALVAFIMYSFFGALVVGLFLYYATRPVYRWLDDRSDHPDVTATITLLVVGLPLLLVLGYTVLVGIRELDQFLISTNVSHLRSRLSPYVHVVSGSDERGVIDLLRNNLSRIRGFATAAFTWFLRLFVIVTVAFYLLRDDQKIARWFRRSFNAYPTAVDFMEQVDDDLTTIYTGNLITIGVTGLLAAAVFYGLDMIAPSGAGLLYPVLLGLLVGVATLIPAVGMKLVYFPYTGYLLWRSQATEAMPLWFPVVFFVVTAILVDWIPDLFIRSYLSKGELNMGLMVLTYVLAAIAFGWYGVFFGPVILVFSSISHERYFQGSSERRLGLGERFFVCIAPVLVLPERGEAAYCMIPVSSDHYLRSLDRSPLNTYDLSDRATGI